MFPFQLSGEVVDNSVDCGINPADRIARYLQIVTADLENRQIDYQVNGNNSVHFKASMWRFVNNMEMFAPIDAGEISICCGSQFILRYMVSLRKFWIVIVLMSCAVVFAWAWQQNYERVVRPQELISSMSIFIFVAGGMNTLITRWRFRRWVEAAVVEARGGAVGG